MPTARPSPDVVEREWAGAVAVVLGGGPSLTRAQAEACHGRARVLAIKQAIRIAPWADAMYFCDEAWGREHRDEINAFRGAKFTLNNYHLRAEIPGLKCLYGDVEGGVEGFAEMPDELRHGRNSGYQAIHLAAHLGARQIVLLGFDMKPGPRGEFNWHGEQNRAHPSLYDNSFLPHFPSLADALRRRGLPVVNATPGSALACFPKEPLEVALA